MIERLFVSFEPLIPRRICKDTKDMMITDIK